MLKIGKLDLDLETRRAYEAGTEIVLTALQEKLLFYLCAHIDQVISKAEIQNAVWGKRITEEGSLTNAIYQLRELLGDKEKKIIKTLPKRGYIFSPPACRSQSFEPTEAAPLETPPLAQINGEIANLGSTEIAQLAFDTLLSEPEEQTKPPALKSQRAVAILIVATLLLIAIVYGAFRLPGPAKAPMLTLRIDAAGELHQQFWKAKIDGALAAKTKLIVDSQSSDSTDLVVRIVPAQKNAIATLKLEYGTKQVALSLNSLQTSSVSIRKALSQLGMSTSDQRSGFVETRLRSDQAPLAYIKALFEELRAGSELSAAALTDLGYAAESSGDIDLSKSAAQLADSNSSAMSLDDQCILAYLLADATANPGTCPLARAHTAELSSSFDKALTIVREQNGQSSAWKILQKNLEMECRLYLEQPRPDSIAQIDFLIDMAKRIGSPATVARMLRAKGASLTLTNNYQEASQAFKQSEDWFRLAGVDLEANEASMHTLVIFMDRSENDATKGIAEKLSSIASAKDDRALQASSKLALLVLSQSPTSDQQFDELMRTIAAIQDPIQQRDVYTRAMNVHATLGQDDKAAEVANTLLKSPKLPMRSRLNAQQMQLFYAMSQGQSTESLLQAEALYETYHAAQAFGVAPMFSCLAIYVSLDIGDDAAVKRWVQRCQSMANDWNDIRCLQGVPIIAELALERKSGKPTRPDLDSWQQVMRSNARFDPFCDSSNVGIASQLIRSGFIEDALALEQLAIETKPMTLARWRWAKPMVAVEKCLFSDSRCDSDTINQLLVRQPGMNLTVYAKALTLGFAATSQRERWQAELKKIQLALADGGNTSRLNQLDCAVNYIAKAPSELVKQCDLRAGY